MPNFLSEDDIEQAIVQRLQHLYHYDALDCYTTDPANLQDGSGRSDKREVIFRDRLKAAKVQGQWQLYCLIHNIEKLKNYGELAA
jgi:type I restriction enzyme R subunit